MAQPSKSWRMCPRNVAVRGILGRAGLYVGAVVSSHRFEATSAEEVQN